MLLRGNPDGMLSDLSAFVSDNPLYSSRRLERLCGTLHAIAAVSACHHQFCIHDPRSCFDMRFCTYGTYVCVFARQFRRLVARGGYGGHGPYGALVGHFTQVVALSVFAALCMPSPQFRHAGELRVCCDMYFHLLPFSELILTCGFYDFLGGLRP